MAEQHIGIYLNDHLAGAKAALNLLDGLQALASGDGERQAIAGLRTDIAADCEELQGLIDRLGLRQSAPRKVAGWLGEKIMHLKLRLDDRSDGKLRMFESLEVLALGIEGKKALWRALAAASESLPGLRVLDYQRLERRAEEQRDRVEGLRLRAAREALVL